MKNEADDKILTAERVRDLYARCFRPESEYHPTRATRTQIEGWLMRHTFSVPQLAKSREEIIRLLLAIHRGFRSDEGQGGSVGMLTMRDDNVMWTGDMSDIEKLLSLGMAVGLVTFCVPREKWDRLPNGLPYVRIEITKLGVSVN